MKEWKISNEQNEIIELPVYDVGSEFLVTTIDLINPGC